VFVSHETNKTPVRSDVGTVATGRNPLPLGMGRFNKDETRLTSIEDKWIYFVKNAGNLHAIPESLNEPCIIDAFSRINEAAMTAEELELQWRRHDFIHAQRTSIELAEEKGEVRGRQQALIDVARNLLDVLDDDTIALKTGLTIEQIRVLRC
jgi:predicted transposase/invertase (TIGR01784 family)